MSPAPETDPANPDPKPAESRDASGRFAKGNPGGPGNPYPRRMAAFRRALLNCITEEDIIAMARAVIEEAKEGNVPAAKLIFQYVLGKPGSVTDLGQDDMRGMQAPGMCLWSDASTISAPAAPMANGSNGETDESQAPTAPKANGSNGGGATSLGAGAPSGLGREADQWLDRQMRRTMEALGKEPLLKGL
jgi:hypothetical protein